MIRVWADRREAGVLDRLRERGTTFAYAPDAAHERAVSITMPVRVQSWDQAHGLLPIFDMNLPEGALKERLRRLFAKATGSFDEFDLLLLTGRTQLGRIRYSSMTESLDERVPFQSVDEILRARRDGGLFDHLLERFAQYSGLSGVQPKVMIQDAAKLSATKARRSSSILAATHIVKMWEPDEYPELAANEHACLRVAQLTGLKIPPFTLSDSGDALVIERFDLTDDGYLGLEDFCVLNGLTSQDKYRGSYESRLFKRAREFVEPADEADTLQTLFRVFVLNCAIRNGDAHLKNFALTYESVDGPTRLAPVYDLVTTTAYLPQDVMALTLEGSTRWPDAKRLTELGRLRAELSTDGVRAIFEETADAMSAAWREAAHYFAQCSEPSVGKRIKTAWESGIADTLGLSRRLTAAPNRGRSAGPRRPRARSQAAILEHLRAHDGRYIGTLTDLAAALSMPQSTISGAVRTLTVHGLVMREGRRLELADREV